MKKAWWDISPPYPPPENSHLIKSPGAALNASINPGRGHRDHDRSLGKNFSFWTRGGLVGKNFSRSIRNGPKIYNSPRPFNTIFGAHSQITLSLAHTGSANTETKGRGRNSEDKLWHFSDGERVRKRYVRTYLTKSHFSRRRPWKFRALSRIKSYSRLYVYALDSQRATHVHVPLGISTHLSALGWNYKLWEHFSDRTARDSSCSAAQTLAWTPGRRP